MYVLFSFTMAVASGRAGQVYSLDSVYNVRRTGKNCCGQKYSWMQDCKRIHGYIFAQVKYRKILYLSMVCVNFNALRLCGRKNMETCEIESPAFEGYDSYHRIWDAAVGSENSCEQETHNTLDIITILKIIFS